MIAHQRKPPSFALLALCCTWMLSFAVAVPVVRAQEGGDAGDAAQARRHFKMGVEFFRENNFGAALIEFERAYEIVPHYKVLFNLGQTYIELQEYGKAVEALQGYLDKGGEALSKKRRDQVTELIAAQQARLVTLRVECDQDGARVYVDENLAGTTPLDGPLQIGAGRRRVRVSKEGFVTAERRVDLGAGDDETLAFELEPTAASVAVSDPPQAQMPEPTVIRVASDSNVGLWVAGVTTVVLAGATATLAVLTSSAESDLKAERGRASTASRLQALSDDVELRALLTDVGIGLTAASAVITTILWATADDPSAETPATVGLGVGPGAASLRLHGCF